MTSEPTTQHPTRAGEVVQNSHGKLGIVTAPAKKAGIFKGKITAMRAFDRYGVAELPEDLTVIDPAAVHSFATAQQAAR